MPRKYDDYEFHADAEASFAGPSPARGTPPP